ncbi:MAG: helix-turn-helix transcriptional regulator [Oscillospiraceae bacterium]|nr:helix-turn-helix transcriptional regulator [Oscillospiraceae bacterium]
MDREETPMEEQSIAKALKYLMGREGVSVSALAVSTGIPAQTLYSMLSKRTNQANLETLEKLAEHFGVGIEIFCGVDSYTDTIHLDKDEKKVIDMLRSINEKGKRRLYEYAVELTQNPIYKETERRQ